MLGDILGPVLLVLAAVFYGITAYHGVLVFLGMRMTRGGRKPFDRRSLRNPVDLPRVSIIIPAKDEEVVIEGAIRCAEHLQYPRELLEILVVEDGSSDETPTIGKRMAAQIPNVLCISGGESKGKPAALNRALARASGEVIAIFDSDTRYAPDLLLRVAKHLHDHPEVDVAQAFPQVMNADRNLITRLNFYEMRFWFQGLQAAKERYGLFMHLGGTGMFIRRSVFEALGEWDEGCLTEDLEYSIRVARSGRRVGMLDADIWIQPTYRTVHLVRQRQRWWGGALQVLSRSHRYRTTPGVRLRASADAAIYLSAPIFFLVASLVFLGTLGWYASTGSVVGASVVWLYGLVGSTLFAAPLVIAESAAARDRRLLWLIPGLYWYWFLQVASLLFALGSMVAHRPVVWRRTPKIRVD